MEYTQVNVTVDPKMSVSVRSSPSSRDPDLEVKSSEHGSSLTRVTTSEELKDMSSILQYSDDITPSTSFLTVPPTTPAPAFSFEHMCGSIFRPFPDLDGVKLPYVREVGIKSCLEMLSGYFNCEDYKLNSVQFWFLDVITDCLWKMQDEFQFPESYQKIIVEWILYVIDLIRDPLKNLSRREFFEIFNEAMLIGNERIQAGSEFLPRPRDLFKTAVEESEEVISYPSSNPTTVESSSISLTSKDEESYVAAGIDETTEIFELPKLSRKYYNHVDSIDNVITKGTLEDELLLEEETFPHSSDHESFEFYQADPHSPDRFRSSSSSSFQSIPEENDLQPLKEERFAWKRSPPFNTMRKICSDEVFAYGEPSALILQQQVKIVTPAESTANEMDKNGVQQEWSTYLKDRQECVNTMERNILINSCALFAINQFVYDYFYETFQYSVVKFALINTFSSVTQNINTKWHVPKVLKEELRKPKPKKEKKKKRAKNAKKKPKKKMKGRKNKIKKKPKKSKSKKSSIKSKKKKLTKEEKAELARLKREQQRLEEELRKAEENRRLLFPLKEATDEDFFKEIFENWVEPKDKKGKKGKDEKAKKKQKAL